MSKNVCLLHHVLDADNFLDLSLPASLEGVDYKLAHRLVWS